MKPLTVYKASAGSGKTFTLAVEYIKLLIENPLGFKNILAVTFTNKATEEMKLRILSQLYGIWKLLPESETYLKTVCGSLGIDERLASRRAGMALAYLIHNYHYFRVETIDSFFQSILRNLARELDLTANLRVGLNDIQVEEEAVDRLIDSLGPTSVMLKWLMSYIFSSIDENKNWNVIGKIKQFGTTIFRDFYKNINKELSETVSRPDFFVAYTKEIKAIRDNAKKRMAEFSETFERETEKAGLTTTSYAGKNNGICSYFKKLRSNDFSDKKCINKTLEGCLASAEKWTTKTSPDRDVIISLANGKLMQLLNDAETERPEMWEAYSTAEATLAHLDKLRLLNSIEEEVNRLNKEANRFLLSDTQHLLHTLISDSDSPFIFEKTGCRLNHIMIDEFQDTGSVQWQNFKVLLNECMSHGGESDRVNVLLNERTKTADNQPARMPDKSSLINNLIVGDVKQSIYRWRSGDWRLLNNIEGQFRSPKDNVEIKNLHTNYRSERNIIEFNNHFFEIAAKLEYEHELDVNDEHNAQELLTAYADVRQDCKDGMSAKGLVRIELLEDEDYENKTLVRIDETIEELLKANIAVNDIAILVRYNWYIPTIANYLMDKHPGLKVVSDEAFRLDSSMAVNTIVQALRLIVNPDDVLTKANLAITYQKKILNTGLNISDILDGYNDSNGRLNTLLPSDFIKKTERLSKMPLIDVIERIYSLFNLNVLDNQNAYVCAFYDEVADFVGNNSGNIRKFLKTWDDEICKSTIQSDNIDGIRLISIHKSKGLEFDNVIIPYCDWPLEKVNGTILWCNPKKQPFNKLPIVPVDYRQKLLETIYADDYRNEHIQNRVDNLNLLYVAFTRAGKNLFVLGRSKAKRPTTCRSELILQCLPLLKDNLEGSTLVETDETDNSDATSITFEYGNLAVDNKKQKNSQSNNVFLSNVIQEKVDFQTSNHIVNFKQSNKSRDFIGGEDLDEQQDRYIDTGKILHKLFSTIHTTADIDKALKQFEFDGILYDDNLTVEKMRKLLSERLSDNRIADWFSKRWKVYNECAIISYDKATAKTIERRPDRVISDGKETKVIDFKFGKPHPEYEQQVRQYMELLKSMGHENVKGYLWFVYSNEIKEII